jgi:hypothetical protein
MIAVFCNQRIEKSMPYRCHVCARDENLTYGDGPRPVCYDCQSELRRKKAKKDAQKKEELARESESSNYVSHGESGISAKSVVGCVACVLCCTIM